MAEWLAVARRVEVGERLRRARGAGEWARVGVAIERERAAEVMVRQGDWRREQGGNGEAEYRQVMELFEGTRAAGEARVRLGLRG